MQATELSAKFIAGRDPTEVITAICAPAGGTAQLLKRLIDTLPHTQHECLLLARAQPVDRLNALPILAASLHAVRGDCSHIHFEIATLLDAFLRDGVQEARYPCLIHCFLMQDGLAEQPRVRAFGQTIIARELDGIAPRDAAAHAIQAHGHGSQPALKLIRNAAARYQGIAAKDFVDVLSGVQTMSAMLEVAPLHEYALCTAAASGAHSVQVCAPEQREFPAVQGDHRHYIFRDAGCRVEVPGILVYGFDAGTISIDVSSPGMAQFYVFDGQGRCISDLSHGLTPFIAPDCAHAGGAVAVLDDRFSGSMSVCHFLLDRLTRMPLYKAAAAGAPLRFLLADDFPYYRTVIDMLGLTGSLLFPDRKRFSVRAERLLLSSNIKSPFLHPAHKGARWAVHHLRRAFHVRDDGSLTRRLFISRKDSPSGRGIHNWHEVEALLAIRKFDVVTLTGMPMDEQLQMFANASHIAGVHGAGLTNMVFANRQCKVLEILPPLAATPAYWLLATGTGQDYRALIAQDAMLQEPDYGTWVHNHQYAERDVLVPIDRLAAALDAMGCLA